MTRRRPGGAARRHSPCRGRPPGRPGPTGNASFRKDRERPTPDGGPSSFIVVHIGTERIKLRWLTIRATFPDSLALPDRMPCHVRVRGRNPFPRHFHVTMPDDFILEVD